MKKKKTATSCDLCCYYVYDEDDECYVCDMNLDEDDMVKFLTGNFNDCPFFKSGDEYAVVRKQMSYFYEDLYERGSCAFCRKQDAALPFSFTGKRSLGKEVFCRGQRGERDGKREEK